MFLWKTDRECLFTTGFAQHVSVLEKVRLEMSPYKIIVSFVHLYYMGPCNHSPYFWMMDAWEVTSQREHNIWYDSCNACVFIANAQAIKWLPCVILYLFKQDHRQTLCPELPHISVNRKLCLHQDLPLCTSQISLFKVIDTFKAVNMDIWHLTKYYILSPPPL